MTKQDFKFLARRLCDGFGFEAKQMKDIQQITLMSASDYQYSVLVVGEEKLPQSLKNLIKCPCFVLLM